jgi:hypothetical protein
MAATAAHSNDVLRLLLRVADHLGACAEKVGVAEFGDIVPIEITQEQIEILQKLNRMDCRTSLTEIASFDDVKHKKNKELVERGNPKEEIPDIINDTDFNVVGEDRLEEYDCKPVLKDAEGRFYGCFLARVGVYRYAFNRQVVSNFCQLNARPLKIVKIVGNTRSIAGELSFPCVEAAFQLIKGVLSGATDKLTDAVKITSPGALKGFGRKFPLASDNPWLKANEEYVIPVAFTTMYFLQAWAATCENRWNLLYFLMHRASQQFRVSPDNVFFYEHNDDTNYGTGCHPDDCRVLFSQDIGKKGENVLGKALSKTARLVYASKTYERYRDWFIETFEDPKNCLFVLKQD